MTRTARPAGDGRRRLKKGAGWLAIAVVVVAGFEGLRTYVYRDVVGVATYCYGETSNPEWGREYSVAECDELLARRLVEFNAGIDRCLRAPVPERTRAALVSFAYNVGLGAFCRSTLVAKANAGDIAGACNELPRWNRAGGRVVRGLTLRREAERALCIEGLGR